MLWSVYCVDRANSTDLRMSLRPDHLDYLKRRNEAVVLAGATLTDDGGTMTGSLLVIDVADRAAAEAFSADDPFTKGGLFERVEITRMRKGIWNPAQMPES